MGSSGEWQGDWSDRSELWKTHSHVRSALDYQDLDDGSFWMSWEDFIKNWKRIGVVHRTIDILSLRIPIKNDSFYSPLWGCFFGCLRFWFCCEGPRRLYCPRRSSEET